MEVRNMQKILIIEDDEKCKIKLIEISADGYYVFKVMDKNSEVDTFMTRLPKELEVLK